MLNMYNDVEKNFSWMRTVTPEEAQNCKERMYIWAETNKKNRGGFLGKWVYTPLNEKVKLGKEAKVELNLKKETHNSDLSSKEPMALSDNANKKINEDFLDNWVYESVLEREIYPGESDLVMALTKWCAQRNWNVPSYFPCCPEELGTNPLEAYFQNLKVGALFAYNDVYPESKILEFVSINNNLTILVMCVRENIKPWSIAEITFENGVFVHSNVGSYFDKASADKEICIKQGLEWVGGDTFDDFC